LREGENMIERELNVASDFPPVSYAEWRASVVTDLKGARSGSLCQCRSGGLPVLKDFQDRAEDLSLSKWQSLWKI
jgi:hypothetical protein